ncbi:MAG: hypothetical protein QOF44_1627 [Streptomyces sp.]|nr:hypothetical protein [Streptomyces sp.]
MRPLPPRSNSRRGSRPFASNPPGGNTLPEALRTARLPRLVAVGGVGALLIALGAGTSGQIRAFLDFGVGVLCLVALTSTVVWGLVSTDEIILGPRQRIMTQGIHRGLGVAAVCFLIVHISVKVSEGHATMFQVFLPAGFTGQALLIFLGTFASYTMILAAVTGALRSAFAERRHPVRWRILHCTSYASWCAALVHGLNAGRTAKTQFVVLYVLCLIAVAIALVVRLRTTRGENLFPLRPSASGTGGLSPQGSRGRSRRAEPTRRNDGVRLAYTDPLPPLPNFPPVAPPADSLAGLPPVYAEPLPADATAQLPPIPDQGQYYETPAYGTEVPTQGPYGESADVSATRLQPVNWQQPSQAQGPYYNGGQR